MHATDGLAQLRSRLLPLVIECSALKAREMNVEGRAAPLPRILYHVSPDVLHDLASGIGRLFGHASGIRVRQFAFRQRMAILSRDHYETYS